MKKFIKTIENFYFKFSFVVIYIIHKILVLLKNHLNFLKDSVFECFLRSIIDFHFSKTLISVKVYNDGRSEA